MSGPELSRVGQGRFRVTGDLDFVGVAGLVRDTKRLFADAGDLCVDLGGVAHANSAGLALVLEWLARARREGRELRLINLPESMQRLAELSNLRGIIESGERGAA